VVQFRRQMIAAAKRFREGGAAIGTTGPLVPRLELASFEGIVPKTRDWRSLGISQAEREAISVPSA
jgi:phthalate 4,5-dioxygenase oxygenase subunit